MKATWSDRDSDSDYEETKEVVNFCLMALEEDNEVNSFSCDENEHSLDEMFDAKHELHNDLFTITKKYKNLKKKLVGVSKENDTLKIKNEKLRVQNAKLKKISQDYSLLNKLKEEIMDLKRKFVT